MGDDGRGGRSRGGGRKARGRCNVEVSRERRQEGKRPLLSFFLDHLYHHLRVLISNARQSERTKRQACICDTAVFLERRIIEAMLAMSIFADRRRPSCIQKETATLRPAIAGSARSIIEDFFKLTCNSQPYAQQIEGKNSCESPLTRRRHKRRRNDGIQYTVGEIGSAST
jgi:hypothetical protein